MIKHIFPFYPISTITPLQRCFFFSVLLIVVFYSLFMATVSFSAFLFLLLFPPPPSVLFLLLLFLEGSVQFYVNCIVMKRQNLSLWNDKTATIPPFCLRICFILRDALQSSKGGTGILHEPNWTWQLPHSFAARVCSRSSTHQPLASLHLLQEL